MTLSGRNPRRPARRSGLSRWLHEIKRLASLMLAVATGVSCSTTVNRLAVPGTAKEPAPTVPAATTPVRLVPFRGRLLKRLPSPGGTAVVYAATNPPVLLTAGADQARIWNAEEFSPLTNPMRHGAKLITADIASDGRVLTAGGDDAKLWDPKGSHIKTFRHGDPLRWAAISADGTRVAMLGVDGRVRVWNTATGHELFAVGPFAGTGRYVRFAPRGDRLLTVHDRNGVDQSTEARVWSISPDGSNATEIMKIAADFDVADPVPNLVDFSPDGERLAIFISTNAARISQLSDRRHHVRIDAFEEGFGIRSVSFSPDSKLLLTGEAAKVRLWDTSTGKPTPGGFDIRQTQVRSARIAPTGTAALVLGYDSVQMSRFTDGASLLDIVGTKLGRPTAAVRSDGAVVAIGWQESSETSVWQAVASH